MTPEEILSQPARVLTEAQREKYVADGFVSAEGIVPADTLAELQRVTNGFTDWSRSVTESDDVFDIGPGHSADNPVLRRLKGPDIRHSAYWDFATGSDTAPTAVASGTDSGSAVYRVAQGPADITQAGGLSPYGVMGLGGNVWEWEETDFDLLNSSPGSSARGARGGSWGSDSVFLLSSSRSGSDPSNVLVNVGFRVASIPEPNTMLLGAMAIVALLMRRKR